MIAPMGDVISNLLESEALRYVEKENTNIEKIYREINWIYLHGNLSTNCLIFYYF